MSDTNDATDDAATAEEIAEWEEEHDEPHPVFSVPHRPERQRLEFSDDSTQEENEQSEE